MNEKIQGLEEEKEELVQYTKLDKEKRSLEYNLYTKEQNEVLIALEALEESYAKEIESFSMERKQAFESEKMLVDNENQFQRLQQDLEMIQHNLTCLIQEKNEDRQEKTRVELQLNDYHSKYSKNEKKIVTFSI